MVRFLFLLLCHNQCKALAGPWGELFLWRTGRWGPAMPSDGSAAAGGHTWLLAVALTMPQESACAVSILPVGCIQAPGPSWRAS